MHFEPRSTEHRMEPRARGTPDLPTPGAETRARKRVRGFPAGFRFKTLHLGEKPKVKSKPGVRFFVKTPEQVELYS